MLKRRHSGVLSRVPPRSTSSYRVAATPTIGLWVDAATVSHVCTAYLAAGVLPETPPKVSGCVSAVEYCLLRTLSSRRRGRLTNIDSRVVEVLVKTAHYQLEDELRGAPLSQSARVVPIGAHLAVSSVSSIRAKSISSSYERVSEAPIAFEVLYCGGDVVVISQSHPTASAVSVSPLVEVCLSTPRRFRC